MDQFNLNAILSQNEPVKMFKIDEYWTTIRAFDYGSVSFFDS